MAYEIPQELEYQEKIIFGLTFKQLLYAIAFLPCVLFIITKLPLGLPYRIALALIPASVAGVFMYTSIPLKLWNWWKWLPYRYFTLHSFKMKNYFGLQNIKKDVLTLKDKKLSIIKVEPINFSIRNEKEKEVITNTFQKFLNSLDFPVQIIIATDKLNLDYYLRQLEERTEKLANKDYEKLFEDYKTHLQNLISSNGLLNRSFYLVIPEKHDIGLTIQVGVCEELLNNMNLKYTKLHDDELLQCLSSFFNDLYEDDPKGATNDILSAEYLHRSVAPSIIKNNAKEMQVGQKLVRTIAVKGYPRIVEEGFLDKIVTLNGDFDLSIHIEPFQIETMMVTLNRELQKQRADLWSMEQKGIINPSLEVKYKDTRQVLEQLQKGNEKLFNVSLYITCKGRNKAELDLLYKKVESELNALMMIPYTPAHEMHKALKSAIPLGTNELGMRRNIPTKALSAFFPFTSQFLQVDETGIWLGLNKNNIPLVKDIFKLQNANGVALASSGGGKSYFTKLMIARMILNGTKVIVVDPQSEYTALAKEFHGEIVEISKTSETIINPLDLMGHDYDEKKLTLLDMFPLMLGQTSEIQKAVLDKALTAVYESKGITRDKVSWKRKPPIMGDLLAQLKTMSKKATTIERETYRSLINRIEMYSTGVFSFLNRQTNLNFQNRFVVFNIGDMPNQVKPTIMFLILDYVYMKMKKDRERKLLVIDEAWSLLERSEDESYIFKIVRTCRKFNLGLLLITQDVGDLLKNDAGKALLNNSEYTLLLRQKPSIIDQVENTFKLSQKERERLLTAQSGEGIIIINNEHSEIKIVASPEEHNIITTNPDELLQKELANTHEIITEYDKGIDLTKGFFKKKQLTEEQITELLKQGYEAASFIRLFGGRRETFLLKPRHNESLEHFFVTKLLEEYIRKYTDKVELYVTQKPDIVFETNKGTKVAVEIETGKKYTYGIKVLKEKVKTLNKKYGENWFFVVTDWQYKEKYAKLGKTYVRKEVPAILKKNYFSPVSNTNDTSSETLENKHFEVRTLNHNNDKNLAPSHQDPSLQKNIEVNNDDSNRIRNSSNSNKPTTTRTSKKRSSKRRVSPRQTNT